MTNGEKYRTVKERYYAFRQTFGTKCEDCQYLPLCSCDLSECIVRWLDLEAEVEKILPCPYCGGTTEIAGDGTYQVVCMKCMYASAMRADMDWCIADHNRVARDVMAAEMKKEVQ